MSRNKKWLFAAGLSLSMTVLVVVLQLDPALVVVNLVTLYGTRILIEVEDL